MTLITLLWILAVSVAFVLGYICAFFMWAPHVTIDKDEVTKQVAAQLLERIPIEKIHHETQSLYSE